MEEIFRTDLSAKGEQFPSASSASSAASASLTAGVDAGYVFRGLICYYGMHYIALFWCFSRKRWILFDDTCVKEKQDWNSVVNLIMTGLYVPTLVFYECLEEDSSSSSESLEELTRQVNGLEDRNSSCVLS